MRAAGTARLADPRGSLPALEAWHLVAAAGGGELTCVYQARPAGCPANRPVGYGVKLLRPQWENDARAVELLRREAVLGRQVNHPHLITILSSHVAGPPYYVVMPWLTGATLAECLQAGRRPSPTEALWYARQVAAALGALHEAGWIHGDIKPSNIFVSAQGHVTLLDLGFASRPDQGVRPTDRPVMGTPAYLAPELLTTAWGADVRSDIYSLGVTLYELLSGRRPFAAADLQELMRLHREAAPLDIRSLLPQLPREASGLLAQMLAKAPLRRPQTPAELIERLSRLEIELFAER